jgi:hypothetical protein
VSPLRPTGPSPRLEGLGVNVRATLPGYPTAGPDGQPRWLLAEDLVIEETTAGDFLLIDPVLPEPVVVSREDIVAAAAQVANLIVARRSDARRALEVLDAAIHGTDQDALRATIANSLLDGKGEQ